MSVSSARNDRHTRREAGASAVEFALVLPVLLLLVFGIVQYGFYFLAAQSASSAAREAVRRVAVGDCTGANQLKTFVDNRLGAENVGNLVVTPTYKKADGTAIGGFAAADVGDQVELVVQFRTINLNIPFVPVPGDATVAKRTEARIEDKTDSGTCQ